MELPQTARVTVRDGVSVFYRHAGSKDKPVLLLVHGYPSSSFYYRNLMTLLSDRYRVIAPDMPGFGFTTVTAPNFEYTFANIANVLGEFADALSLKKFALYVFDFGAPWGYRLALQRPDSITAIISQNGNMYEEGLGKPWGPLKQYWATNSEAGQEAIRARVKSFDRVYNQYRDGSLDNGDIIEPENYWLDYTLLQRPGIMKAMESLFYDYRTNVEMYPDFQKYLRERQPPVLAVWGKNDISFIPAGAEAFKKDLLNAEIHLVDAGHFALTGLETVFAGFIKEFLSRRT